MQSCSSGFTLNQRKACPGHNQLRICQLYPGSGFLARDSRNINDQALAHAATDGNTGCKLGRLPVIGQVSEQTQQWLGVSLLVHP